MKINLNNYSSLKFVIDQGVKGKVTALAFGLIGSGALGATYPQIGDRIYSLPKDVAESSELSEPSIIAGLGQLDSGMRDPITDRDLAQKSIVSGDLNGTFPVAKARSTTKIENKVKRKETNIEKTPPKYRDREQKESAFVDLKPMAITGRTTNPSLKFTVGDRPLEPSDSVRTPKLIDNVYEDAKKIR